MAASQGYPKRVRLCSRKDIEAVFRSGRYRHLGLLHVKYLPSERAEARFLVSVKKKVGSAPVRNRLKRLVREAIRLNREQLGTCCDVCIFLTRPPEGPSALAPIEDEVRRLFRHLNRQSKDEG